MARPAQDITESELSVLRILWDRGPATIRQLTDVLYPRGGRRPSMRPCRSCSTGWKPRDTCARDRSLYVHVFAAVLDRDELIGRRLRSLAETLCDGSMTPLLTHLARAKDLTVEDRLALRAIIDEPEEEDAEPGRPSRPELAGRASPIRPPAVVTTARRVDDDQGIRAEIASHGIAGARHVEQRGGRGRPGGAGGDRGAALPPARLDP